MVSGNKLFQAGLALECLDLSVLRENHRRLDTLELLGPAAERLLSPPIGHGGLLEDRVAFPGQIPEARHRVGEASRQQRLEVSSFAGPDRVGAAGENYHVIIDELEGLSRVRSHIQSEECSDGGQSLDHCTAFCFHGWFESASA